MPQKILIVDDDPDVVLFLSTVLQDHGYETVDAHDGLEGIEQAKTEQPDLVLLDLMMPHKSGLSLLSDLRGDPELSHVPVIMVTGVAGETGIRLDSLLEKSAENEDDRPALRPEGYIEKPVDPEGLVKMVRNILSKPLP